MSENPVRRGELNGATLTITYELFTEFWPAMGTSHKTITVTDQQNEWIKAQIKGGDFTNDSEYIRDLIRRDQTRRAEIEAIRDELIKGEKSGEARPFSSENFKKMAAEHAANASE